MILLVKCLYLLLGMLENSVTFGDLYSIYGVCFIVLHISSNFTVLFVQYTLGPFRL